MHSSEDVSPSTPIYEDEHTTHGPYAGEVVIAGRDVFEINSPPGSSAVVFKRTADHHHSVISSPVTAG